MKRWTQRMGWVVGMGLGGWLAVMGAAVPSARAAQAYGTINNFDVVNDTGTTCHGFEIEIEDIHSQDITYTYNWNHYGTPTISEDNSNPQHPRVKVRYASRPDPNGGWAAYTAVPSGPVAPTDGHQFTNPSVNFGGEHFGVGYRGYATNIAYFWLVDNGAGVLVRGPQVQVATPVFNYYPPQGGAPPAVQAVIEPPPARPVREFGPALWVKEIRTTSHNNREVKLRELVTDDPDDPEDRDWRNGEPDEVEVEWQLLQEEFRKADGGNNGELLGQAEDLLEGDEVVTRRYEFFEYVGPIDPETGEAIAESVGPDGLHGEGVAEVNGQDTDLSTLEVVGNYLGAQMSAFDVEAPVGLIEQLQDGVVGQAFPRRTVVIAGAGLFTSTNWGVLPPGLEFNRVSGELSGTPTEAGVYQFTVEARSGADPVVRRTYTMTVAEDLAAAAALPASGTIDTVAAPLDGGVTTGDGIYRVGELVTVTATPAPGLLFSHWVENGRRVSRSAVYTFTSDINRSLTAVFAEPGPRLRVERPVAGGFSLLWPTNAAGYRLEESSDLDAGPWQPVAAGSVAEGTNNRVQLNSNPAVPARYYRLTRP